MSSAEDEFSAEEEVSTKVKRDSYDRNRLPLLYDEDVTIEELNRLKDESSLSPLAAYCLCAKMSADRWGHFNYIVKNSMDNASKYAHSAAPMIKFVEGVEGVNGALMTIRKGQEKYLNLMNENKHARFSLENMSDHSDPRVVHYLREIGIYYYNTYTKVVRLADQKRLDFGAREKQSPAFRKMNYYPPTTEFEKATLEFLLESESTLQNICKEIFDLLDVDYDLIGDRDLIVPMIVSWRKESPFKEPIKGIRHIYLDEYRKMEDIMIKMSHELHRKYSLMDETRESLESMEVPNPHVVKGVGQQLCLLHRKVALLCLEEAKISWEDMQPIFDSLFKVELEIQEARIETLNMDYYLLEQLVNHAENEEGRFIPEYKEYPPLDCQMTIKPMFIKRVNKKLDAAFANMPEDKKADGTYEQLKKIAFEKEMEKFEELLELRKQELNGLSETLFTLARNTIKQYFVFWNMRFERDIKNAEAARVLAAAQAEAEEIQKAKEEAEKKAKAVKEAKAALAKANKAARRRREQQGRATPVQAIQSAQ